MMYFSGAAGNRTPVQTSYQIAFYMLIHLLVFEVELGNGTRFNPYLLVFAWSSKH
jgi:hypothetical protein